jgi:hypothetical protein
MLDDRKVCSVEIKGTLVADLSIFRSRDSRACDPQGHHAAADDNCESRTAFLSPSVKTANTANPLACPFCTTLVWNAPMSRLLWAG